MAELGNQIEPSRDVAATAPLAEGSLAPEPMLLRVPAPGEVLSVTAEAGGIYIVDPAAQGLGLEMAWRGDDLVLSFSGAGSIQIQGAANLAEADAPPLVALADGTELGVDRLIAALDTEGEGAPLETAAGPEAAADGLAPGDGFHGYSDYQGEAAIAGLAGTGTLGEEALSGPSSFDSLGDRGLDGESGDDGTSGTSGTGGTTTASGSGDGTGADTGSTFGGTTSGGTTTVSGSGGGSGGTGGGTDGGTGGGTGGTTDGGTTTVSGSGGGGLSGGGSGGGSGSGGKGKKVTADDDDGPGLSGDDVIAGGEGADNLVGGANDDTLDGGAGDDRLNGSAGDDVLIGGLGDDQLQGGSGADVFLFDFGGGQAAPGDDVVEDFNAGAGDALRFVNVVDSDGDGADLDDLLSVISEVEDDGRDVTIEFEGGGTLVLDGLGTGAIDTVTALLNEIGQASVEMA